MNFSFDFQILGGLILELQLIVYLKFSSYVFSLNPDRKKSTENVGNQMRDKPNANISTIFVKLLLDCLVFIQQSFLKTFLLLIFNIHERTFSQLCKFKKQDKSIVELKNNVTYNLKF